MTDFQDIPAGTIDMRDDRNGRQWSVSVQPFRLARYPVTQGMFLGAGSQLPAVEVSWLDAVAFCNALSESEGRKVCYQVAGEDGVGTVCDFAANGYRLPTEAEWQHACRAGNPEFQYGALDSIAWYAGNSGSKLHPVGGKVPNAWGLYDMLGNVWEWCFDLYNVEVYGAYRIFRGGSFAEDARGFGATNRRRSHPTFRIDDLGFRLALSR
jgi:formylglycine-generating enzyme required for sulfatase activity